MMFSGEKYFIIKINKTLSTNYRKDLSKKEKSGLLELKSKYGRIIVDNKE